MTIHDERSLIRACAVEELPPGEVMRVPASPAIALFNVDGEFHATSDLCTHDKSSLSEEGFVENGRVECGWHYASFCIKTGDVKSPPASEALASYPVHVLDGVVYVAIDARDAG
jgi:3-phenylpropionate/trans-cinnamate dioxygenase ferredoxin subunit